MGVTGLVATGNPEGLIITSGMKAHGEGKRQQHPRRQSQGYGQGNRRAAQASIPGTGLDSVNREAQSPQEAPKSARDHT